MTSPVLSAARTAPVVTADVLCNGGDVLVLAPHPDDESLGCGAAIAALSDLGHRVQVIVVTDGAGSHPRSRSHPPDRLRATRAAEVARAVDILTGGRGPAPVMLGYPDAGGLDEDAALARILPHVSGTTRAVWSTWGGDPHCDHGQAARLAERLVADDPALALWFYPIWGRFAAEGAVPDPAALVQFDGQTWHGRKEAAIAAHVSQMTGLIGDDPGGFRMSAAHQSHFLYSPEIFLRGSRP